MMDVRSRRQGTLTGSRGLDWDNRVRDRISKLNENEIGYPEDPFLKNEWETAEIRNAGNNTGSEIG